jgi:hypothetical protein
VSNPDLFNVKLEALVSYRGSDNKQHTASDNGAAGRIHALRKHHSNPHHQVDHDLDLDDQHASHNVMAGH